MSEKARAWARERDAPCSPSKAVLLEVASMANADGECWPSNRHLAHVLQVTPRSIQRSLAKLKAAGLIQATTRRRDNGGQTSNLYRLPIEDMSDVPRRDAGDAGPVTQASPQEEKNQKKDTSDEVSQAREHDGGFSDWWSHYPKKVGMRGAKALFERLVRRGHVIAEILIEAARSYAASVRGRDPKFVKDPANWLRQECWDEGDQVTRPAPQAPQATQANFAGPIELRAAVAAAKGDAWIRSWFDPCRWSAASRSILPRTDFAGSRLRQDLGALLQDFGVAIGRLEDGPRRPCREQAVA